MSKPQLTPQGDFPPVGLGRRLAAMFYDFLLCTALLIVTAGAYKMIQMAIIGEARMRELTEAGALDGDPLLSTVLLFVLFGFFAKFWTHGGQTLGMQVWGVRVQNADGTAISLWQALLRFVVSIASWLCLGLGFFWALIDKRQRGWHDIYSESQLVRVPKPKK
ncbi:MULTISPECIES: RDD family protein [Pseudomonas]|uniref:RDD family protein n=1 Tax=Pseudomonas TaxID=286 RepID=UPI00051D62F8|nr:MULTISPECIES: RDD family protein [Pseudomonas]AJG15495.1 RDD domain-containing protein [Pseudomonas plecoglossicida]KGK23994.1 RDD domain-containing protein [Pseudomonas plecoglossicida]KGK24019.1 RDD domain-containing protein [Pseudomonas plecoglossicida]MBF8790384.1 RDD family protein [Pseudomonas asiatica]MDY4311018.1 RDD family protein [Pseudomonas putida]